jgi:hypothetical protein
MTSACALLLVTLSRFQQHFAATLSSLAEIHIHIKSGASATLIVRVTLAEAPVIVRVAVIVQLAVKIHVKIMSMIVIQRMVVLLVITMNGRNKCRT